MNKHCSVCGGWVSYSTHDEGQLCYGFGLEKSDVLLKQEIEQLRAERDAWKVLHDAKGYAVPYAYASQEQRKELNDALKVLGIE